MNEKFLREIGLEPAERIRAIRWRVRGCWGRRSLSAARGGMRWRRSGRIRRRIPVRWKGRLTSWSLRVNCMG